MRTISCDAAFRTTTPFAKRSSSSEPLSTTQIAEAAIDPTPRVDQIMPLDEIQASNIESTMFIFCLLVGVTAIALLLSLAGIYPVMAFTVARRTREIGVRVALGSSARQIVTTIFALPLRQVAFGIVLGGVMVTTLVKLVLESITAIEAGAIAGYAVLMLAICLLACVVPTRRALRIQPTELSAPTGSGQSSPLSLV